MLLSDHPRLRELRDELRENFLDYLADDPTATYGKREINQIIDLIDNYLSAVSAAKDAGEGRRAVRRVVLALNALNEAADFALIETMEREDIAELLILAGHLRGFNGPEEDITEEWRDW